VPFVPFVPFVLSVPSRFLGSLALPKREISGPKAKFTAKNAKNAEKRAGGVSSLRSLRSLWSIQFWLRLAALRPFRLRDFASNSFPLRSNLTKMVRIKMPSNSVLSRLSGLFAANQHKCLAINNLQQIWCFSNQA
jgi:hypothetical protein